MKKLLIICFICSLFLKLNAIDFNISSFQVNIVRGQIISHDQKIDNLKSNGIWGAEMNYLLPSKAFKNPLLGMYNHPEVGLGLVYLDLGNPELTGQLLALYPYMNWKVLRTNQILINLKPGVGMSYLTRSYDNTNQINKVIGSKLNVYFALGANLEYNISKNLSISWDIHANHASNGNFKAPNIGYNILNNSIGLKFYTNFEEYHQTDKPVNLSSKQKYHFEIIASGGRKELYYKEDIVYTTGSIVFAGVRNFNRIFKVGLGTDLFYNQSYSAINISPQPELNTTSYQRTYITEDKFSNRLRVGLSIQPELVFNRVSAGIHLGIYLYNPIRNLEPFTGLGNLDKGLIYPYDVNEEDGWFYSRAALKYRLTDELFISLGLKTHLNKSEFIEWGLGYKF